MKSNTKVEITLTEAHYYRVVDALDSRRAAYEATARYHEGDEVDVPIEEVDDADEAWQIAREFAAALVVVQAAGANRS